MTQQPLRLCLVAAECTPFAKVGGLGDFAAALTRHLARAGHQARLFVPAHGVIDWSGHGGGVVEFLREVPVQFGDRTLRFNGVYSHLPGTSTQVYFIDCPELFHRPTIYTDDPDEALRFAFLTRAVLECCQRMGWAPDVFHCNDWHAALLPVYLRGSYGWDQLFGRSRSLLTIHNIGYQGIFDAGTLAEIGLANASSSFAAEDLQAGQVNLLKTGVLHCELITTVSPTHAREIQTEGFGMGLDGLLRRRADRLVGILNGVDYEEWDPNHDALIPYRYGRDDLRGKAHNKRALLRDLALPVAAKTPLIGMVSRLVEQKGIDLLAKVLPELLAGGRLQVVVLGSGERRYEELLQSLQIRFPDKLCFYRGYNNQLAHRIEAASDIYLMPSLYEPCGLNQMYSLRYGAVPVVRRTGGLADSVEPFDPAAGTGTGFLFDEFRPESLRSALVAAMELFADRKLWRRLMRNGMSRDFSWQRQVLRYEEVYRRMIGA